MLPVQLLPAFRVNALCNRFVPAFVAGRMLADRALAGCLPKRCVQFIESSHSEPRYSVAICSDAGSIQTDARHQSKRLSRGFMLPYSISSSIFLSPSLSLCYGRTLSFLS